MSAPKAREEEWLYPGSPFSPHEFVPSSGSPVPDRSPATIARVAARIAVYDGILIRTGRHDRVHAHFEEVLARGLASPGRPHLGGRVLGPSGSGKTTAARAFAADYASRGLHAPGERPVMIVPLERASTSKRVFAAILRTAGDDFAHKGTEEKLQTRAYEALRRLGTRLLVVDEVQHLRFRSTERNDATDTLKRMLDDAVAPLVLCGTEDAAPFLNANPQLGNRLLPPCDLPPLLRSEKGDLRTFRDYVARLDAALVDTDLTGRASGLADKRLLSCLMEISGGVLGRVSNLVRAALWESLSRGADAIELRDLVVAVRDWAIAQGFVDYCPISLGVRRRRRPGGGRA